VCGFALERYVGAKPDFFLLGILLVAAIVRFVGLGAQSYWIDEAATVAIVRDGLGHAIDQVVSGEATPPLYYVVAWMWAKVFGTGEAGLRSLSAVLGTVTVPLLYLAARSLVSRRVALAACALFATSPLAVWYGQEARAYALLYALLAGALWLFARSLRQPSTANVAGWAVVSLLALATHYFAIFFILPQAAWFVVEWRRRRRDPRAGSGSRIYLWGVAAAAVGAVPMGVLALHQLAHTDRGAAGIPTEHLIRIPGQLVVGYGVSSVQIAAGILAAALLFYAIWRAVARLSAAERPGIWVAATIGASALGIPLVLALLGLNFANAAHVQSALLAIVIVIGAGLAGATATRASLAGLIVLCLLGVAVLAAVATDPLLQRVDYRGASRAVEKTSLPQGIVVIGTTEPGPFQLYLSGAHPIGKRTVRLEEIDVIGLSSPLGSARSLPPRQAQDRPPMPGFEAVGTRQTRTYRVVRFRSARPLEVSAASLVNVRGQGDVVVLVRP